MAAHVRFSDLSAPRQALVSLCQQVNFGEVRGLLIRNREPYFTPPPSVAVDIRLDAEEGPRPESSLPDFALPQEFRRLMAKLDELQDGTVETILIRDGLPRRVVLEARFPEVRR